MVKFYSGIIGRIVGMREFIVARCAKSLTEINAFNATAAANLGVDDQNIKNETKRKMKEKKNIVFSDSR